MLFADELINSIDRLTSIPTLDRTYMSEQEVELFVRQTCDSIKRAQIFAVSNVAEYFYVGCEQEHWDLFNDFPRPVPPFRETWMEWTIPKQTNREGKISSQPVAETFHKAGVLLHRIERGEPPDRLWRSAPKNIRFVLTGQLFLSPTIKTFNLVMFPAFSYAIDYEFAPCDLQTGMNIKTSTVKITCPWRNDHLSECQEGGEQAITLSYPAWLGVSFLNCKNVKVCKVQTPPALVKKHKRAGRDIITAHDVIEIQPITTILQKESGHAGYSKSQAAIMRGHFKDYSQGKGLFGKLHGLYWWDQVMVARARTEYRLKDKDGPVDPKWEQQRKKAL